MRSPSARTWCTARTPASRPAARSGCSFPNSPEPLRPLILASRSPQRRAILGQLGITFEVVVSGVAELEAGAPEEVALANAQRKAAAVAAASPDAAVLGVDTVVALDGAIYGKPADAGQARATLEALSGRRHIVISGVCLIEPEETRMVPVRTHVWFRDLGRDLVEWYVAGAEWRERAGGYAIQGRGAALVRAIEGDYSNVVGLPVATLLDLMPERLAGQGVPAGRGWGSKFH